MPVQNIAALFDRDFAAFLRHDILINRPQPYNDMVESYHRVRRETPPEPGEAIAKPQELQRIQRQLDQLLLEQKNQTCPVACLLTTESLKLHDNLFLDKLGKKHIIAKSQAAVEEYCQELEADKAHMWQLVEEAREEGATIQAETQRLRIEQEQQRIERIHIQQTQSLS